MDNLAKLIAAGVGLAGTRLRCGFWECFWQMD